MSDLQILGFTLKIALVSTLLILPVALALAAWLRSLPHALRAVLESLASLPLVLPPTAIGLILLEMLSRDSSIGRLLERGGLQVLFTPAAVVMAASVMSFPLMFRSFRVALESVDPRFVSIARTLGAGPSSTFFRVLLPLSWRGLLSGILLAYTRAVGEFGATVMIAGNIPGRTQTLALAIYQRVQTGREETADSLLMFALVIAFVAVGASEALTWKQARRMR